MSLWRRDRLRVVLTPERTLVLRPAGARATSAPMPPWQTLDALETLPAHRTLAECLASPPWRGCEADLVLSNRWVCHVLSEAPGALLSPSEEQALAQARICAVYGGQAQDWRISVHSQPPDAGILAAAVSSRRIQDVQDALGQARVMRFNIRPLLSVAARALGKRFRKGWWVVVEPGWWCLLKAERGAWRHIHCQPCGEDWPEHLAAHLLRTQRLVGDSPVPAAVWVQPIDCTAPQPLVYPPGWTGKLLLPPGKSQWDWDRI